MLISNAAFAQQGCCEGGSATGANAWTTGNTTDQTPANIAGATAPPPLSSFFTPIGRATRPGAQGASDAVVVDPRRNRVRRSRLCQQSGAKRRAFRQYPGRRLCLSRPAQSGEILRVQHDRARSVRRRPCLNRQPLTVSTRPIYGPTISATAIRAYLLNLSKIGEQYFSFGWDQTPHVYSTSAQTPYLGVGTSALTLPPGLLSKTATSSNIIVPFLHQTDVGIERDTASASYRWTPTEAWDVRADYSHMDRNGTQPAGVVGFSPAGSNVFVSPTQVPGAGQRHHAEFRRQRRICRHLALESEIHGQVGLQRLAVH